jgi:CheY-like chemotaxis protein
VRPVIDAHRHELVLEIPDDVITVDGDKTRLVQVVGNILHNAAKFTEPGGRISLKVARDGPHVRIRIADTGIGIRQELLPRLFELFSQVHSKSERSYGGLGIGLALVRRLTEMHGGTVSARSDGPGCGSEFTIVLPVLAARSAAPPSDSTEAEIVRTVEPRRILVADDNDDAAEALSLRLQLAGHDVRTARNGIEAVAVAKTFGPDVVLLDLGMPKMDGYEAARQMRRQPWGKRATLVALTGWGQQQDRQRTTDAGFDAHLVKPVAEADLLGVLASVPARSAKAAGTPAG